MSGNQTPALVRTGAPMAAGSIIVAVARVFGLEISVDQALLVLPAVMFIYYAAGRALETWHPKLGYVLGIAKAPAYSKEPSPSPGPDERLETVVVPDEESTGGDNPVDEPYVGSWLDDGGTTTSTWVEPEVVDEPDVPEPVVEDLPSAIKVTPPRKRAPAKKRTPVKKAPAKKIPPRGN